MPFWQWIVVPVVVVLLLFIASGCALVLRRRAISRNGGTFELSIRARPSAGRGWVLGLGRYSGEQLEWFRIFSLAPGPRHVWDRSDLTHTGRREPAGTEQMALYAEHVIVMVDSADGTVEMAMSPSSLMGFQSWLESSPPGTDWNQRRPRR